MYLETEKVPGVQFEHIVLKINKYVTKIFGNKIKNQCIGKTPIIQKVVEKQQGLDMEIDFRDFYASLLNEWFDAPMEKMNELFKIKVNKHNIFNIK